MIVKELLQVLLQNCPSVFVNLDRGAPGVVLPDGLPPGPQIVLELVYDMPLPIPNLRLEDDAIRATLSFGRTPFEVTIPWGALLDVAPFDNRLHIKFAPPEAPEEVAETTPAAAAAPAEAPPAGLRLVKG